MSCSFVRHIYTYREIPSSRLQWKMCQHMPSISVVTIVIGRRESLYAKVRLRTCSDVSPRSGAHSSNRPPGLGQCGSQNRHCSSFALHGDRGERIKYFFIYYFFFILLILGSSNVYVFYFILLFFY